MLKVLCIGQELVRVVFFAINFFVVGLVLHILLPLIPLASMQALLHQNVLKLIWDLVGVALVGLVPLTIWMGFLIVKHCSQSGPIHKRELLDYEYISNTAPSWGLLGTIIALVMAGSVMAQRLAAGASSDTILGILPLVAQALISTVVGLLVQLAADSVLHVIERKRL